MVLLYYQQACFKLSSRSQEGKPLLPLVDPSSASGTSAFSHTLGLGTWAASEMASKVSLQLTQQQCTGRVGCVSAAHRGAQLAGSNRYGQPCVYDDTQAAIQGDPRRPQEVKKMGAVVMPPADDLVSHTILIGAMSAGVAGIMFQVSSSNMSILVTTSRSSSTWATMGTTAAVCLVAGVVCCSENRLVSALQLLAGHSSAQHRNISSVPVPLR